MNKTMKYVFFASALSLLSALMCCQGGAPRFDSRLAEADSLLRRNNPDSALRLLSGINASRLSSASDRAYHALLLTQAQYRCYVDITSDSTINVALDYYQRHANEQEKLTRAYIYKGAVTEELGNPEVAMACYKQAASAAATSDHFNQGYAKMRIGSLYRDNLVMDSVDITFLKQALHHFAQVPDSFYVAQCLSTIGNSYAAVNKNDSAIAYLEKADTLIKTLHLTGIEELNLRYLADLKMFSTAVKDITAAKDIAVTLVADGNDIEERDHLLLIAAFTLARLNKADSASHYLNLADKDQFSDGLRVLYNRSLAEVARCRGDMEQFQYHFLRADDISDSLLSNTLQLKLRDVEAKYDNEVLKNKSLQYRNKWFVSLLIAGVLAALVLALRRRLARRQRLLRDQEETIERLHNDRVLLASQLNAHQAMSDELKQAIRKQIDTLAQLVEMHAIQYADSPSKFSKAFEEFYRKNKPKNTFWAGLRAYANSQYNDIIDKSIADCPSLIDTDINYLTLYCCDLPTSVIMACLGYKEAHSAYNKKRRVAETMGLTGSLDDYIAQFKAR